ncbi:MAG: hypothetical protein IJH63_09160 [Methanobrevibacter sp.]|nr:hypothetical protein [Methanobrevibacter sp.]
MSNIEFKDCEYRFEQDDELYCKNKQGEDTNCDNCKENIHLNCDNYNPGKDLCLKYFKPEISQLKECQEKTTFSDKELSRKWSN